MKIFSIRRITDKWNIYHRTTEVWLCIFGWKYKLLYRYGIREYHWYIPGVKQYLEPIIFGTYNRVPPASTKWENEYFTKQMFTNLLE